MNAVMDEIQLYFTITGDWDPGEVTAKLNLNPSDSWKKGNPKRTGGEYTFSRWCLGSGLPKTETFDDHLKALLDLLRPVAKEIRQITLTDYAAVVLAARYKDWTPGIVIDSCQMKELADLGVVLDFDLYFSDQPEKIE